MIEECCAYFYNRFFRSTSPQRRVSVKIATPTEVTVTKTDTSNRSNVTIEIDVGVNGLPAASAPPIVSAPQAKRPQKPLEHFKWSLAHIAKANSTPLLNSWDYASPRRPPNPEATVISSFDLKARMAEKRREDAEAELMEAVDEWRPTIK